MKTLTSLASMLVIVLKLIGTGRTQPTQPVTAPGSEAADREPPPAGFAPDGAPLPPSVRVRHVPPILSGAPGPTAAPPTPPQPPLLAPAATGGLPASLLDPVLARKAEERRSGEAERLSAQASRLLAQGQYERAARMQAISYALDPRSERLLRTGLALRRADLDLEALAVYLRVQREAADPSSTEIVDALSVLRSKTEDADVIIPRTLRSHLERGRQHFLAGQFQASLEEYALAYAMKSLPRLLFNAAQALRRAGRVEEAYILYVRFLAEEPPSPLRKEALGYAEELRTVAFRPPLHRRAWFWGVLGTAVAVIVAGSAGLAVSAQPEYPMTDTPLQVLTFGLRR